mmetsp:Transcript_6948/g.19752  ORF Transcript_6948/g.19752 Transcript_6948/m.19752 type:complete len:222 (-) Transcript_6948:603-1268(-)
MDGDHGPLAASLRVHKVAVLARDGDSPLLRRLRRNDSADDLGVHIEGLRDLGDGLRRGLVGVELHPVAHVEDLVHLLPGRLRLLLDDPEHRRRGQHVVLDDMQARAEEVEHLCLRAAGAVDHAVHLVAEAIRQDLLHDRRVGAGRGEDELAGRDPAAALDLPLLLKFQATAVDEIAWHRGVEGLRELRREALDEGVVPRSREAVAADAAVVRRLVRRLAAG